MNYFTYICEKKLVFGKKGLNTSQPVVTSPVPMLGTDDYLGVCEWCRHDQEPSIAGAHAVLKVDAGYTPRRLSPSQHLGKEVL